MTKADEYFNKMTQTPVPKLIMSLGLPTTISMLITNIYNLADTYFIGDLGESAQAATGILFTLQAIIQAIAFMLGHGSGTYVAKALADKNTDESSKYVSTAFFTGGFFGILLTVTGLALLTPFMRLLGSTETILPYAKDYGMCVLIACPFMICSLIINNNLRYEGKAFYAMIGLTTGGIINIFGDWILIKFTDLGVLGAGISTAVSQFISFTILLICFEKNAQSKIRPRSVSFSGKVHWEIIKGGLPSLLRQGLSSISNGLLNNLANPFGDAAIAAISIVNRFSGFVMCVGLGVGQGFQPVSSFNFQAKRYKRVKQGLLFTMFMGFLMVGAMSAVGAVCAKDIIWFFQDSKDVIEIGVPALRYACFGLLFLAISIPINMLNQSIRRSFVASFLSILRSGALFIPTLFILNKLMGLNGIILSQPIADMLAAIISIPFIVHFMREKHDDEIL